LITKVKHTVIVEDDEFRDILKWNVGPWHGEDLSFSGGVVVLADTKGEYWVQYFRTNSSSFGLGHSTTMITERLPAKAKARFIKLLKEQSAAKKD
jgi:hypothetical protein